MIPKRLHRIGESPVASYTSQELIEGTGIVEFNNFISRDGSTSKYNISSFTPYGEIYYVDLAMGGTPTTTNMATFETSALNYPRLVEGTGMFTFSWRLDKRGGAVNTASSGRIDLTLQDYDGTSATTIATASTVTVSTDANTGIDLFASRTSSVPMTLPRTLVQTGHKIRLKVDFTLTACEAGVDNRAIFWCDPQNSNITAASYSAWQKVTIGTSGFEANTTNTGIIQTTQFKSFIPFRIDA